MRILSGEDLASRRRFDCRVVRKMANRRYVFTAHRTAQDAEVGRNPITKEDDARFALHYRAQFNIRTLIGPGQFSACTIIRIDASHAGYPFQEPIGWVIESGASRLPYSPHFARGAPVCNGSIWRNDGHVLIGHYLIHLARLLNWHEVLSPGYGGYNPDAIAWWRRNIGGPLDSQLVYPALPASDLYGDVTVNDRPAHGFRKLATISEPNCGGGFKRIG
jgi:hypothetical protein